MNEESWEEPFHRANKLIGEKRIAEALGVLTAAKSAAIAAKNDQIAAFYSSVLGSLFASEGEHGRALSEYAEAERRQPDEPSHVLRTARLLLDTMNRPDDALKKIESVLRRHKIDDDSRQETRNTLSRLIAIAERDRLTDVQRRAIKILNDLAA